MPKARIFPLSRDELVECAALLDAVRRGELDRLTIPPKPLDVLAQQIVAEVAAREWREDELFALIRRAWPYAHLPRDEYLDVVRMLAEGFSTRRGHRAAYVHRDAVNGVLRGRRGARLTALTSGGAIPDTADYDVVLEPSGQLVGTVNEDFAVESLAGDIFQLGNTSYRIRRIEAGRVRVEDAHGQAPTIPFWLGEAPARTDELSYAVARLRDELAADMGERVEQRAVIGELTGRTGLTPAAAEQIVEYLAAARAALGVLPTQTTVVLERFFDESGGMQLVIHSPFGSRINRAWGLALRKRFCVKFNFELQAAATEDAIVISLSTSHSFPLDEVARYLNSRSVRQVLIQAMLGAPMFTARWRWIATTSLALPRFRGGKKVPAPLQRMRADDLMAVVFPDQIACAENLVGERDVPDHPLVRQAIHDCLFDAMDIEGLEKLLRRIEAGDLQVVARDLVEPSPLALEILSARPYAYLDDAPLEERRAQAVMSRRWLDEASAADLGQLDAGAIERVRAEAWPEAGGCGRTARCIAGRGLSDSGRDGESRRMVVVCRNARQPASRRTCRSSNLVTTSGSPRKGCRSSKRLPGRAARTRDRRAGGIRCARLVARRRAGRDRAEPARRPGAGHRRFHRAIDAAPCDGHRARAREAGGRGRRDAGILHARRDADGMVRPGAAGAHSPLHGETAAPGDRAGHDPGFHALPVSLAARDSR